MTLAAAFSEVASSAPESTALHRWRRTALARTETRDVFDSVREHFRARNIELFPVSLRKCRHSVLTMVRFKATWLDAKPENVASYRR